MGAWHDPATPTAGEVVAESALVLTTGARIAPASVVLDSGAGITVVDKQLADRIGLVGHGAIAARDVGGRRAVTLADDVTIRIGSVTLAPMTVAILDLDEAHADAVDLERRRHRTRDFGGLFLTAAIGG